MPTDTDLRRRDDIAAAVTATYRLHLPPVQS